MFWKRVYGYRNMIWVYHIMQLLICDLFISAAKYSINPSCYTYPVPYPLQPISTTSIPRKRLPPPPKDFRPRTRTPNPNPQQIPLFINSIISLLTSPHPALHPRINKRAMRQIPMRLIPRRNGIRPRIRDRAATRDCPIGVGFVGVGGIVDG